ncbi:uncharacterized protein LOC141973083 [Athene noctua]|uniref:uncharacterized protein LOC141973083 n=1 Tax=Athene noctua TaxID=126797 RepID=UPI003EC0F43B
MSSLHHNVAPVSAGGREAQLSLRLRGSQRAGEQMDQEMDNVSKREGRGNKPNFWRRCCHALRRMEEWKLTVLIFISSLFLWGLFMVVLPCASNLLSVLTMGLLAACWPRSKAKGQGSSAEEKSCPRDGRKDPIGAPSVPWEAVEGATESQTAGRRKRHEGEGWESGVGGDAASARELPHGTGDVGRDGNVGAATSSELLRSQPSSSHSSDLEELATSLMESLGGTRVCCDLLGKLKEARDRGAPSASQDIRKEYATCLECRRCLTGSCPHRSEPLPERDLPTLAAILHSVDLLVHREELQLELGMGFELVLAGETVYVWQRTHRFPEIPPERCCKKCSAPLPRSLWASESSQAPSPVLSAPGAAQGQMRAAGQDAGAPPARDREAKGSAELQPAARGESPPPTVPVCTLADMAQTPSSAAPARVSSAVGLAQPSERHEGLGQRLSRKLKRLCHVCATLRDELESCFDCECFLKWMEGSSAPSGTARGDKALPGDHQFQAKALPANTVAEAQGAPRQKRERGRPSKEGGERKLSWRS